MTGAQLVGAAACAPEIRARLVELRDEIAKKINNGRTVCARSKEWAALPVEVRMAYLLVAGIDGDLQELAVKSWREYAPLERDAIRAAVRTFSRAARAGVNLSAHFVDPA